MSRTRLFVLMGLILGLAGWMAFRPSPQAAAAPVVNEFHVGENTEDVALHRYQTNQARHWRQAVTRH